MTRPSERSLLRATWDRDLCDRPFTDAELQTVESLLRGTDATVYWTGVSIHRWTVVVTTRRGPRAERLRRSIGRVLGPEYVPEA